MTRRTEARSWDDRERRRARAQRRRARAERREARWTRPKPPQDWRYVVGGVGRILIVTGLLMFGFVAYQLWGTGLEYAQAQDRLDDELEELFAAVVAPPGPSTTVPGAAGTVATTVAPTGPTSTVPAPTTAAPTTVAPTTTAPPTTLPAFQEGDALARLEIPRIGVDAVVVAGVSPTDLKKGPGHYPGTPMPGQLGNSAIAGHRTTYGQPFFDLDDLEPGDEIVVTTIQGRFVYRMTGSEIVGPDAGHVVLTTDPNVARLTLTTCDPKYTATNRLIVYAELDPVASGAPQPPVLSYGSEPPAAPVDTLPAEEPAAVTTTTLAGAVAGEAPAAPTTTISGAPVGTLPAGDATSAGQDGSTGSGAAAAPDGAADEAPEFVDAFSQGWFHDSAAWAHVIGWGLAGAAVAIGGYYVARALRRYWAGIAVAAVPFLVVLYFFYQNVNRLLPAAI